MSSRNQEIDDQAAEWAAKRALRDLTPEEQAELTAWLASDVRHLGAFTRARAIIARLDRAFCVSIDELCADDAPPKPRFARRQVLLAGGLAASVAAACLLVAAPWKWGRGANVVAPLSFATAVGQTRQILLADGSVVTLNTNSKVAVELTADARSVSLLRGEALFDVARDKERPFVVYAGDTQVRAVGTSFTVSMLPQKPILVLVREGIVELKRARTAPVWVSADSRAMAPKDTPFVVETMSETKIAHELAWQYGRIALDQATLRNAADEFARYSDVRIVVDPAVADRTVTGMFASNDPVGFAEAAAAVLKLRIEVREREVRIF